MAPAEIQGPPSQPTAGGGEGTPDLCHPFCSSLDPELDLCSADASVPMYSGVILRKSPLNDPQLCFGWREKLWLKKKLPLGWIALEVGSTCACGQVWGRPQEGRV